MELPSGIQPTQVESDVRLGRHLESAQCLLD